MIETYGVFAAVELVTIFAFLAAMVAQQAHAHRERRELYQRIQAPEAEINKRIVEQSDNSAVPYVTPNDDQGWTEYIFERDRNHKRGDED
jgi:hypothetical protein